MGIKVRVLGLGGEREFSKEDIQNRSAVTPMISFCRPGNRYLCTYDLYSSVHSVLDACISITRASGRGLGPGNGIEPIGECYLGPKIL